MLSNQTCYRGVGAPLHEKTGRERKRESEVERVLSGRAACVIVLW